MHQSFIKRDSTLLNGSLTNMGDVPIRASIPYHSRLSVLAKSSAKKSSLASSTHSHCGRAHSMWWDLIPLLKSGVESFFFLPSVNLCVP